MSKRILKPIIFSLLILTLVYLGQSKRMYASTGSVNLSGDVTEYLALSIFEGDSIAFGNINPGVPACSAGNGSIVGITTSASNGYTLSLSDGSNTNSAMRHTDTTTYIPDMSGTFANPSAWINGTTKGLGVTMYAADTTKEAKWGTGITACSADNLWSGVPADVTVGHTVNSYHESEDTSKWGWKIDTDNSQKTGTYTGQVLFTAVPNL